MFTKKAIYTATKDKRTAYVTEGENFVKGKFIVDFFYDGYPDFEWKRGAHGMSCDICDTLEQAKRKARNYIKRGI